MLFLPISRINPSLGIFSILYSENSPPSLKLLATIASTGKIILHIFYDALDIIFFAIFTIDFSFNDFPIFFP